MLSWLFSCNLVAIHFIDVNWPNLNSYFNDWASGDVNVGEGSVQLCDSVNAIVNGCQF